MKRIYLSDKDVADLLGVSIGRLRNKIVAGDILPPRIEIPGSRRRLWPKDEVYGWINQFSISSSRDVDTRVRKMPNKRGRPRKIRTITVIGSMGR